MAKLAARSMAGGGAGGGAMLAGGGEEGRTRGLMLELCPPRVLTMLGLGDGWIRRRGFMLGIGSEMN